MNRKSVKQLLAFSLILLVAFSLFGCGKNRQPANEAEKAEENKKLKVVTTLFPYYDFTRQVAGDRITLSMVVPAGMDSHSFEPTPADVLTILEADVLICNGGALEHWLTEVLEAVDTSSMTIMTGMDYVDTVTEEIVEGMEESHDHGHEEDSDHETDHDPMKDHVHGPQEIHGQDDDGQGTEIEYDEHIWTSPVNAITLVEAISHTLKENDRDNSSFYEANAKEYIKKLEKLDFQLRQVSNEKKRDMIVVGDKFPFRYLAEEYGLQYRAAFSGCSTDTEPSAKTIAYLIDKMQAEKIPVIYYLELSSHRVSEIISEETEAVPLLLHSCHNLSRQEFDSGVTYLELMEQNVVNLRKGLDE